MDQFKTDVLVIAPYTKRFGVAVFRGEELEYFSVATFARPRTVRSIRVEVRRRLMELINEFSAREILVKQLSTRQTASRNQRSVVNEIFRFASAVKVSVRLIPAGKTDRDPAGFDSLAELSQRFPELGRFARVQNIEQRNYYRPLLVAVALGAARQHLLTASASSN